MQYLFTVKEAQTIFNTKLNICKVTKQLFIFRYKDVFSEKNKMKNKKNNYINLFKNLFKIISELREKCPWDKKQTINSLRHLTIEEVYELSEAILKNNNKKIEDE